MAAVLLVALLASIGAAQPQDTRGHSIPGFERFLAALAMVESSNRYDARNPTSGAYGKYQIIPSSWRLWAAQVLGNANAPMTPANQERVARAKINEAIHKYGTWRVVAYWWLTGRATRNEAYWTAYAKRYVDKVMALYHGGIKASSGSTRTYRFQDTYRYIGWEGRWGTAEHAAYGGGAVRWSRHAGATLTFTFTGYSVAWIGPKGPTRGRAKVYLDGTLVKTVDTGAARFRAVNTLYRASWPTYGRHTLVIEVVGTAGRPMVAVDEFRVGK